VWVDARDGWPDLWFQRYNSNGVAQGVNTRVYDYNRMLAYGYFDIAIDENGNFVIVWGDSRDGNADIYYQKYNADGEVQGENIKVNDDKGKMRQYAPSIALDRNGNMVIVWQDERNGNYDIYCQRYNSNGVTQGVNTKVNDDAGTKAQVYPSIAMDGRGNYAILWEDYRKSNSDIYCQRYSSNGSAQGANTKVNDDAETASQLFPAIAMDRRGFFVIVWTDYRYGPKNPAIFGQRYHQNGKAKGTNYHIVIKGSNYKQEFPDVEANAHKIVFSWMDNRRSKGWDIYSKIVEWNWDEVMSIVSEENIPTEFALQQNYPNPFNPLTIVNFQLPIDNWVTLKVYDLLGREVATLVNEKKQAGEYSITWNAEGVTSGVYYYRLVAIDPSLHSGQVFVETKKMVVMK
jgi:hypothetical protein